MDDLLDNFANQMIDSPIENAPPSSGPSNTLTAVETAEENTEDGYKYHFVDGSPTNLEFARPVRTTPAPTPAVSTLPKTDYDMAPLENVESPAEEGFKHHLVDGKPAGPENVRPVQRAPIASQNYAAESPAEESYKYHFVDDSVTESERGRPVRLAPATFVKPSTEDAPSEPIDSPAEDGYKYHFVDGSLAGSDDGRPVQPAPATSAVSAVPGNSSLLFNIRHPASQEAIASEREDEGEYNADIDDYDDVFYYPRHDIAFPLRTQHRDSPNGANYNESILIETDTEDIHRFVYPQSHSRPRAYEVNDKKQSESVETPRADDIKNDHRLTQYLRQLHGQDKERDHLLTVCLFCVLQLTPWSPLSLKPANLVCQELYKENQDLKRALKESVPGSNSRAEAAERSLFQIRKTLVSLRNETQLVRFANVAD